MKHNILSLDFWQDTAIYGGKSFQRNTGLRCIEHAISYLLNCQKEKLPKETVISFEV